VKPPVSLVLAAALAVSPALANRGSPGGDPPRAEAPSPRDPAERILERLSEIDTFSAAIMRSPGREATGGGEEVFEGRIVVVRPDRLRLETGGPEGGEDVLLLRGDSTYVYSRSLNQLIRRKGLPEAGLFWKRLMLGRLEGRELGKVGKKTVAGKCFYDVVLKAWSEGGGRFTVSFDCGELLPRAVSMEDDLGNRISFVLERVAVNQPVGAATFSIATDEETEMVDIPF